MISFYSLDHVESLLIRNEQRLRFGLKLLPISLDLGVILFGDTARCKFKMVSLYLNVNLLNAAITG